MELKDLPAIAVLILVAAIAVSIGADVQENVKDNLAEDSNAFQVTNESFTAHNKTDGINTGLDYSPMVSGSVTIWNGTDGIEVGTGNFTIDYTNAKINLSDSATWSDLNGSSMLITYNYTSTALTYKYNVSDEGNKGIDEVSSWFDTVGLVVAAVIVIGIVFAMFAIKRT